jgi:thiol-disulfide isomerase/thioredoxin
MKSVIDRWANKQRENFPMFLLSRAPVGMMCLLRLFTFWTLIVMASTTIPAGATTLNGQPVPEISFQALDGISLTLSTLRGTVMLINFWGTWCAPCLQEIPELVHLSHQFKARGFEVVGIAANSGLPEDNE